MAKFGGVALRLVSTIFYVLAFCCAAIILGLYSYFLATQSQHKVEIPQWQKAVEGISGVGVVYTIFAVVLTCCLGGITFFAFLAIFLDILFIGGFIAIAVLTRDGSSCSGSVVKTPLGDGRPDDHTGRGGAIYTPSLFTTCRLNTVCFAVALIGALIFFLSALFQFWLGRHHQREKRYGPSPQNNYTKGSGIRFFKRRGAARSAHAAAAKDAEAGAFTSNGVGTHTGPTLATDSTYTGNKYEAAPAHNAGIPTAGGYHTGPAGSGVNPYGYENTRTTGTNF